MDFYNADVEHDDIVDAWYIDFGDGEFDRTNGEPETRTVIFDRDPAGLIVGIEIL